MGRPSTITAAQVAVTIAALESAGISVTPRHIREHHGSGSLGTIGPMLREYNAGRERKIVSAMVLPPALQGAILDFMGREVDNAKTELEKQLSELQTEVIDLEKDNTRMTEDGADKDDVIGTLQESMAMLQGRNDQLVGDLATARLDAERDREVAEAARLEMAKALLRLEALPRLESDLNAERDMRHNLNVTVAVLEEKAADLMRQSGLLRKEAQDLRAETEELTVELRQQLSISANMQMQAAVLTAQLDATRIMAQRLDADLDSRTGALHLMEAELARERTAAAEVAKQVKQPVRQGVAGGIRAARTTTRR